MVIVGIVYAVLLAPVDAAGGVPVPWANTVVHVVTPIFALVDWFLAPDRLATPLRLTWVLLLYPAVWIAVVLVRGATDGWVPYPFLDPKNGYAFVAGMTAIVGARLRARRAGAPARRPGAPPRRARRSPMTETTPPPIAST